MNAHTLLQQLRALSDEAAAALENGGVETLILKTFTGAATPIWIQIGIAGKTANTPPLNMNATAIPKRATAGQAPAWFMEAGHVAFVCPRGHAGWMDNHKVAADGKVTPSVVCAVQDCGFHQYVTLLDWTPIPATITTPGAPAPQATGRFSGAPAGAPEKAAKTVEAAKPAATGKAADAGKAVEIRPPGAALVKLVVTGLPAAKSAPAGTPAPRPAQKTGAVSIPASKIVTLNPARHRKPAGM